MQHEKPRLVHNTTRGVRTWYVQVNRNGPWRDEEYFTREARTGNVQVFTQNGDTDSVKPPGTEQRCKCRKRIPSNCVHCALADAHLALEGEHAAKQAPPSD